MQGFKIALQIAASCLLAFASPAAAQEGAEGATLIEMRARDRFAAPAPELAAWEAFHNAQVRAGVGTLALAETHLGLAIARFYAKQNEPGWAEVEAAEALLATFDAEPEFHSELLSYGALLLVELGRVAEAEDYAGRALRMAAARGPEGRADLALAHNALAVVAFARNDLPMAEREFCTARDLTLAALPPEDAMIVTNASSCAVVKYFLERPDTLAAARLAIDHALAHLPPDHPRTGSMLNTAYAVQVRYGRYSEAEPLVRRHLELERSLHEGDVDDVFDPLSMLAQILEARGALEEAEGIGRAAADMAARMGSGSQPYRPGVARTNLARVIARQGRLAEAEAVARVGVERLRADLAPDDWHLGSGEVLLADLIARQGRPDEALEPAERGLAMLEARLDPEHGEVLTARLVRARILAQLGRGVEALVIARENTAVFEARLFDLTAGETEQVSLSEVLPGAFEHYLAVALAEGAHEDAAHAAQMLLLSELAVTNARIAAAAVARDRGLGESLDALEAARAEAQGLAAELAEAQASGADGATDIATRLAEARARAENAQTALLGAFPDFVELARPQAVPLARLQASLGPGELLVLPIALTDRAVTLAIARDGFAWGETPLGAHVIGELAEQVRRSVERPGRFDADAAHRLYRAVFPPELAPLLASKTELVFPASGYLSRLSPAVLLSAPTQASGLARAPWLVATHSLRIVPDLARIGAARGAAQEGRFLGIGAPRLPFAALAGLPRNPGDALDLPELPQARGELERLAAALETPDAVILAEDEAREDRFIAQDLTGFGVIAFATHGLVGRDLPGLAEPALLLAPGGEGEAARDGLLTASEIAGLPLAADWVILSACETAAGEREGAPAYTGLARAFVHAGARSLMLSHWRVRDDAAAFLSVETMRRAAQGMPRAEALRRAQLALMASGEVPGAADPAVWAPFVIVGN